MNPYREQYRLPTDNREISNIICYHCGYYCTKRYFLEHLADIKCYFPGHHVHCNCDRCGTFQVFRFDDNNVLKHIKGD